MEWVEIIEKKDPILQIKVSKSSIKDLFSYLLNETKGFKYQITVKVLLKKYKPSRKIFVSLSQFNNKNSNKTKICSRKFFSRNYVQDW